MGFPTDGYNYAMLFCTLMTPMSRGTISIKSASMKDSPVINPRWLTSSTDVEIAVAAFRRVRQILQMPVLQQNIIVGSEITPGSDVKSYDEIHHYLKQNFASMSHPASTCRMGKDGNKNAVVDSKGRVLGLDHCTLFSFSYLPPYFWFILSCSCLLSLFHWTWQILLTEERIVRIADASTFPFLPPGLPLGVVCKSSFQLEFVMQAGYWTDWCVLDMVAEKIADDIKHARKQHHSEL